MAEYKKPTNTKNIEQKIVPSGGEKKGLTTPVVPTIKPPENTPNNHPVSAPVANPTNTENNPNKNG